MRDDRAVFQNVCDGPAIAEAALTSALWFFDHGAHVFPVDGKAPAVPKNTSWYDYRCSRDEAARLRGYAVPLGRCHAGWLTVVDTDEATDEAWVAAHLPTTPFTVRTRQGWHRYYRATAALPSYIHRDGHTIENRNQGLYVVGPGTRHPSGVTYTAAAWSWRWEDLPFFPADFCFDDRPLSARGSSAGQPLVLPEAVFVQERHATLHKIMRSLAARGVPLDGALAACRIENRAKCRPPLGVNENLDRFLKRAYAQKDRADFVRTPQTGWALVGGLLETGLSVDAALAAVRSIDPTFDPEASA